jgi:hypothetical protein
MEVCNLGVLLFCPDCDFWGWKATKDFKRLKKIFNDVDIKTTRLFAEMFCSRLDYERENIKTLDDLNKFISTRANHFLLTEPCVMLVKHPQEDLENLFKKLFE